LAFFLSQTFGVEFVFWLLFAFFHKEIPFQFRNRANAREMPALLLRRSRAASLLIEFTFVRA
jgi:hypothetical protein